MEKDGEQHPTTNNDETNRACTGSTDHNNINDQEIDHQHLANLLRRSADMVERGEFGSILYEALQDFRVYYKQKYPKTGKRRKKPHQTKDTESDIQSKIETAALSETTDDVAGNAILKDLKESENDASSTTTQRNQKEEDGRSEDGQEKQNYKPNMPNSFSFDDVDVKDGPNDNDDNNNDDGYHNNKSNNADANVEESDEASSANEPGLNTPTAIKDKESTSSLNPNDEEQIDDIPVVMPIFTADVSVAPLSPNIRVVMATTATTTAVPTETTASILPKPSHTSDLSTQSTEVPITPSSSNRVFGKFKGVAKFTGKVVGSTLQNVRKAAMHDGNLKSNSSGREDLDIFTEAGIKMAQSSGRRTSVSTYTTTTSRSENNRFVGVKKTGDAGAPQISPQNNGAKREFYSDSSFSKNPFVDDVNGHGENKNQSSAAFESKHHLNTLGEEPSGSNDSNDSAASSPEGINKASVDHSRATSTSSETMESGGGGGVHRTKPGFQRPNDKSSSLVANGWIEQFRRSKFRYTWKEVLASLVEGTKPGEVTTLWIQRETINSTSGQMELEALHRIPLKALESVTFQDSTSDNQFRLKLHNVADEFVFRCVDAPNDALRWVQILKRHERLTNAVNDDEEKKGSESSSTKGMAIRDLRAICHGAGINTAGMERSQLEDAAEEVQRKGTYFDQKGAAATTAATAAASGPSINARHNATSQNSQQQQQQQQQYPQSRSRDASPAPLQPQEQHSQQPQQQRLGIKELRAICHGAGINTVGMERGELEAAAKEVQSRGTYFDPPPGMHAPSEEEIRARQDEYRKIQQQKEELKRKQEKEAADAAECRRREIEQARRRAAEDEARRRAAEEEARRRAAHEEARRRASIEEQNRRQQEAQAAQVRYAQQQVAWQKQQQIEEQQRRATEHKAAEERRRRDEALRKQQEWAAPSPGVHQQQQQYYHQRQQAYPQQQQRQQQQQQPRNRTPPPRPPQQQQQQHRHSGSDNKYAKMANQSTDDGQVTITKIKHGILIQWALQPPQLQMLRPVSALVTTIHSIFPPALGVAGHDYFTKWKPFTRNDIAGAGGLPDDSKLKKSVRKIRFFLHPDKLPHDLNEEQKFMVKMLWDVTNDAWEEHQKHKEDLDWVR